MIIVMITIFEVEHPQVALRVPDSSSVLKNQIRTQKSLDLLRPRTFSISKTKVLSSQEEFR